ncbi:MAG: hypothetical protein SGILL_008509, partial [Bacillariaceae sp.]
PGIGKANFAFCVNNGLCKAKVETDEPHPGCNCEDGFEGDHCEFLAGQGSGSSSGSTSGSSSGSSSSGANAQAPTSSNVDEANQSVVVAVSAVLVAVIVIAGFFVFRAMVSGGRSSNKGTTAAEAGDAVAEAEKEVSTGLGGVEDVSTGSVQRPFDESSLTAPQIAPARFDEDDAEFEDVEDYSNDQSDASTLTEDDSLSNVQIV